jgi:hypothetical protein
MLKAIKGRLRQAAGDDTLISFRTVFEDASVLGYVVGVGPDFVCLSIVHGGIRFNGFAYYRLRDIRRLQTPHKYAAFVEDALRIRRLKRPRQPQLEVDNLRKLILTTSQAFPLITIHREKRDPDVCHIGQVFRVTRTHVWLLEINPAAEWDDAPTPYPLREITRIDFGGDYEDALWQVGKSRRTKDHIAWIK